MKLMRSVATILLLLFVVATVGTLIAQEVSRPEPPSVAGSNEDLPADVSTTPATELPEDEAVATPNEMPVADVKPPAESGNPDSEFGQPMVEEADPIAGAADVSCVIEAVYFHNTHRCVTCLKIEGDAKAIVEEVFAEEMAAGTLRWSTINMEDNPALSVQYNLASPSLVLLRKSGDQVVDWVLLEETWGLVRSTTRYSAYIIESFSTFLEGCL